MRILPFPSRSVLTAVRALEANQGPTIDELASSVIVVALAKGEPVPAWTMTLLISTMLRHVGRPLAGKLASALAEHVEDIEVLGVGVHLSGHQDPRRVAVGDLLLGKV